MPTTIASSAIRQDSGVERTERRAPSLRGIRFFVVATLLAAPLAFGAVQPWAWGLLALAACVLLAWWAFENVRHRAVRVAWSPLLILGIGFFLLGTAQLLGRASLDHEGTREALIKLATDLIFFFVVSQIVAESGLPPSKAHLGFDSLGPGIAIYSFSVAMFAILQFFSSHGLIYWRVQTDGWTFGPYVNHNHYAGLMEMLIPLAAAYAFSRPRNHPGKSFFLLGSVVAAASVLLSGSRGGFVALAAEALILGLMLWRWAPGLRWRQAVAAGLLSVSAVAVLCFWLDPGRISRRLVSVAGLTHSPEVTLGQRWIVARDTLRLFGEHPWFGTGLGSFKLAFPQVQSFATDLVYHHAHNDYVEALAETGLAGGALILTGLLIFFGISLRNVRSGLLNGEGWIRVGAFLGCTGLLVHSLVDFNLHIPANALWFAVLAAVATTHTANRDVDFSAGRS